MKLTHLFENEMPKITDPEVALNYALQQQKRIPELEPLILTDFTSAFWYAVDVMKERWPEIEPELLKKENTMLISIYIEQVIKERWPEAEPIFLTKGCPFLYKKHIYNTPPSKRSPLLLVSDHSTPPRGYMFTDVPETISDEQLTKLITLCYPNIPKNYISKLVNRDRHYISECLLKTPSTKPTFFVKIMSIRDLSQNVQLRTFLETLNLLDFDQFLDNDFE